MKNTNRIYIVSSAPMSDEEIKIIESYLSDKYHNRITYYDWDRDNQTAYIDLIKDSNSGIDEVSEFIHQLDDSGFGTFYGEPLEDYSNSTDNYSIGYLSDLI